MQSVTEVSQEIYICFTNANNEESLVNQTNEGSSTGRTNEETTFGGNEERPVS